MLQWGYNKEYVHALCKKNLFEKGKYWYVMLIWKTSFRIEMSNWSYIYIYIYSEWSENWQALSANGAFLFFPLTVGLP